MKGKCSAQLITEFSIFEIRLLVRMSDSGKVEYEHEHHRSLELLKMNEQLLQGIVELILRIKG